MSGQQPGDPARLAGALLTIADQDQPPLRFVAGADAIEGVKAKADELLAQAEASRELGGNLAHDDTTALSPRAGPAGPTPRTPVPHKDALIASPDIIGRLRYGSSTSGVLGSRSARSPVPGCWRVKA
jgi:hypothetical protein